MISVVIPCYNAALYVERAVKSVIVQNIDEIEVILVDNNSADNTYEVIKALSAKYSEVEIICCQEMKKGACAARNKGLAMASKDYIQFLDADDELISGKLVRQLELIKKTNADIISGTYEFLTPNALFIKKRLKKPSKDVWKGLVSTRLGITSANLWKKSSVKEVGGWDENLSSSQEYDLLFRLLKGGNVIINDYDLSCYVYAEDNSVSRSEDASRTNRMIDNYVNLRQSIKEYLREVNKLDSDMELFINGAIYKNLYYRRLFSKNYVDSLIKQLNLKVKIQDKIVANAKYIFKTTWTRFKRK